MDEAPQRTEEERLAQLLALLPPAPDAWVQAATQLPVARRALDEIEARILAGAAEREAVTADLESAIAQAGFEPSPQLVEAVRGLMAAG